MLGTRPSLLVSNGLMLLFFLVSLISVCACIYKWRSESLDSHHGKDGVRSSIGMFPKIIINNMLCAFVEILITSMIYMNNINIGTKRKKENRT